MCGGNNIWNEYADFHESVLSGNEKQRYVKYVCKDKNYGGYDNRICGITMLLFNAMLTKRALLVEIIKPDDINSYVLPNGIEWNHRGVPKTLTARNLNMMTLKNFDQSYKMFEDALLSD